MTISEVSKIYDISADTIRYYERIGLIPPINRNSSGNRDFTEEDCGWVEFIKCMRSAGLSIEALIDYVQLFQKGRSTRTARKNILIEQREMLLEKMKEMQATIHRLDKKIDGYDKMVESKENELMEKK